MTFHVPSSSSLVHLLTDVRTFEADGSSDSTTVRHLRTVILSVLARATRSVASHATARHSSSTFKVLQSVLLQFLWKNSRLLDLWTLRLPLRLPHRVVTADPTAFWSGAPAVMPHPPILWKRIMTASQSHQCLLGLDRETVLGLRDWAMELHAPPVTPIFQTGVLSLGLHPVKGWCRSTVGSYHISLPIFLNRAAPITRYSNKQLWGRLPIYSWYRCKTQHSAQYYVITNSTSLLN